MTTPIKAKLKKSDDHTNIDKYTVAGISYYIKYILLKNPSSKIHDDEAIISCQKCL